MDLHAAISAATVTVRKIEALIARYGAAAVKTVMGTVIDAGEELFLDRLRQIPDGTWSHRLYAEASHTGDTGLYRYQLTVRKRGDELIVDNAGTDPQAARSRDLRGTGGGLPVRADRVADPGPGRRLRRGVPAGAVRTGPRDPVLRGLPGGGQPGRCLQMELLISLSGSVIAKMVAAGPPGLRDRALGRRSRTGTGPSSPGSSPRARRTSRSTPTT